MTSQNNGYYRKPTICGSLIVFVCEADLWSVSATGGQARRLTVSTLECNTPLLSPDGKHIAFAGRDEGVSEIYVMPSSGGPSVRLTYQASPCTVCGWSEDSTSIIYTSMAEQAFNRYRRVWQIDSRGGIPRVLPYGPATWISFSDSGDVVICRSDQEYSIWKRYQGGRTGELWVNMKGSGTFKRILADLSGNLGNPLWVGERIYFLSDKEGHGNLYSCAADGKNLKRHTNHTDFYPRAATTDGKHIVFQCGGHIMIYDTEGQVERQMAIQVNSSKPHLRRKFAEAADYLEDYALHPEGHSILVTSRGKPFTMGNWEREVKQAGKPDGVRYRLSRWLHDGKKMITVSDEGGDEALEVHTLTGTPGNASSPVRMGGLDTGRILSLSCSPAGPEVVLTNQRNEILLVNIDTQELKIIDRSDEEPISQHCFSPCGQWIAYSADRNTLNQIFLCQVKTGTVTMVTNNIGRNISPCFDPRGKYLYFISYRIFNPVYDTVRFDIGYPKGAKLFLVTLQKDIESPFSPQPLPLDGKSSDSSKKEEEKNDTISDDTPVHIDCEGIAERIVPFPVKESRYGQVKAVKGKVFYSEFPVQGSVSDAPPTPMGTIKMFTFESQKEETFVESIDTFQLDAGGKALVYRAKNRLRVVSTSGKPDDKDQKPGRSSGWIDLGRIKVSIVPSLEWKQMYRELWRLQRDHFWTPTMSHVDWDEVYERYRPLLDRIATRGEFSDLAWEVHGELGTSHTYEIGGDLPEAPKIGVGKLGADLVLRDGQWIFEHIIRGYCWDPKQDSPLNAPGVNVSEGDQLCAIDGTVLTARMQPGQLLVNKGNTEVVLTIRPSGAKQTRQIMVKLLDKDMGARYREWVLNNRKLVREQTQGRVGYVHIPDMGPEGYAMFSSDYVRESNCEGLIIDVRFNAGGHNSQLIIEKLSRKRVGYSISHHGKPSPLPMYSVTGPIVALSNEDSGSDGDIFAQTFKTLKLGTLIGKRTWGGVVGISSRDRLADGALVTQPEFAIWFYDRGYGIENYGAEPDIEVDMTPEDHVAGHDSQLDKAIKVILAQFNENPPPKPDFSDKPDRSRPPSLT